MTMAGRPISSARITPLGQFVRWFHQDYGLLFDDFRTGAFNYAQGLGSEDRQALRLELLAFLKKHEDVPVNSLRRIWIKAGAQWCPKRIDMRKALTEFVQTL
jgi:hypothetical protein